MREVLSSLSPLLELAQLARGEAAAAPHCLPSAADDARGGLSWAPPFGNGTAPAPAMTGDGRAAGSALASLLPQDGRVLALLGLLILPRLLTIVTTLIRHALCTRERAWREGQLLERGWRAVRRERHLVDGLPILTTTCGNQERAAGNSFLFAGPTIGWCWGGIDQSLFHVPLYIEVIQRLIITGPFVMLYAALKSRFFSSSKTWVPETTDQMVLDIIKQTPAYVACKPKEGSPGLMSMHVPEDLPSSWTSGGSARGLFLLVDFSKGVIVEAYFLQNKVRREIVLTESQKANGLTRNSFIAQCAQNALTTWWHPKTHVLAERSAREILDLGIDELEPSSRFTLGLHEGLIYNITSPIHKSIATWYETIDEKAKAHLHRPVRDLVAEGRYKYALVRTLNELLPSINPLTMMSNADSLLESLEFDMSHDLSPIKANYSEYFRFMMKARVVLRRLHAEHKFACDFEDLFHNLIVHSVDHYCLHKALSRNPISSIDGTGSFLSYIASYIFTELWVPRLHHPFDAELLKDQARDFPEYNGRPAFYKRLYDELVLINQEYADNIVLSTSF